MEMSAEGSDMGLQMMGGPPRDLYELYMTARSELFTVINFTILYFKLIFLIDLGKEMLPDTYAGLRRAAEQLLNDAKTYPGPSQLDFTGTTYRISSGSDMTGLIEVRMEDINTGRDESKEQKATSLLPRIKEMDSKIFKSLIESGVVEVKRPSMEEVLMQDVMASIQEKMVAMYKDEGTPPEPEPEEPTEEEK
jgi:hypothetical protein